MTEIKVHVIKYSDRRNLVLRWECPETGKTKTKSAGTHRQKEAERAAAKLEEQIANGQHGAVGKVLWETFRQRYEDDYVSGLADRTFASVQTAFNAIERLCSPRKLADLTSARISAWQTSLRSEGKSEATIGNYCRHLKAALRWARGQGLLRVVPTINMPKRGKAQKVMKGRPITTEEFERMLSAVPKVVREEHVAAWRFYLRGLWWSGLRLTESLELYWDRDDKLRVDLSGNRPMLRIPAEHDKGHTERLLPIAPEFAHHLLQVPDEERRGRVFPVDGKRRQGVPRADWASDIITAFGEKANVKVSEGKRAGIVDGKRQAKRHVKYASAHDLRRAFGSRWAPRVMPQVLMELMRHESIETTMKYYVGQNAQRTADAAWAAFEQSNSFGNSGPNSPVEAAVGIDATSCEAAV